jgi:hypothetical protein
MAREREDVVDPWKLGAAVVRRPDPEVLEVVAWCLADEIRREPFPDPPPAARGPTPEPARLASAERAP